MKKLRFHKSFQASYTQSKRRKKLAGDVMFAILIYIEPFLQSTLKVKSIQKMKMLTSLNL